MAAIIARSRASSHPAGSVGSKSLMVRLSIRTECTSGAGFVTSADLLLFVEGIYPIGDVNAEKAEQISHVDNNWKIAKSASDCWLLEMAIFVVVIVVVGRRVTMTSVEFPPRLSFWKSPIL